MPGRKSKKSKFKKTFIPVLKWASAIIPVGIFIYILYYYNQFDFLKARIEQARSPIVTTVDSLPAGTQQMQEATLGKIRVAKNEWHPVGGIAVHNMLIENASATPVKSAEVEFKYLNDVQAVVTSKIVTVKTPLPAGKSTKISGLSVGYVNGSVVGCDVKVLSVKL
ncbi:hypothetical protein GCM10010967_16870 [Dyadobacter beijingensis]|uniref:Uncharacterized protein n=1 Tax=Dyadobacter beijingensis TaxID=365489 RepID=A0ABQ2HNJ3_9BACT|nr:hypothetical protein [Dyadobacter beijingensis]GGM85450.1 hypothetical protein GCM10010967_16870 [Dyadobacter beijingensis]